MMRGNLRKEGLLMLARRKVYLAIPYSDSDPRVREERFRLANQMAARLLGQGFNVWSPISHSHPISLYMNNSNDSGFWCENSLAFLEHCDELFVYCIPRWRDSEGVAREIEFAEKHQISIVYWGRDE